MSYEEERAERFRLIAKRAAERAERLAQLANEAEISGLEAENDDIVVMANMGCWLYQMERQFE